MTREKTAGRDLHKKIFVGYCSHLGIFPSMGKDTITQSDYRAWFIPSTEGSLHEVHDP